MTSEESAASEIDDDMPVSPQFKLADGKENNPSHDRCQSLRHFKILMAFYLVPVLVMMSGFKTKMYKCISALKTSSK